MATTVDHQQTAENEHNLHGKSPATVDEALATVTKNDRKSFTSSVKALKLKLQDGNGRRSPSKVSIEMELTAKDPPVPWKDRLSGNLVLMVSGGVNSSDTVFILDSGAAVHVTGNYALFCSMTAVPPGRVVRTANGHTLPILGSGTIIFEGFRLSGILFVPGLTRNLVSVSRLTELDYGVEFLGSQCFIRDNRPGAGGALVGKGRRINGIYELQQLEIPLDRSPAPQPDWLSLRTLEVRRQRLGHD